MPSIIRAKRKKAITPRVIMRLLNFTLGVIVMARHFYVPSK